MKLLEHFQTALNECNAEYERHFPLKGESWRVLPVEQLGTLFRRAFYDYLEGEESNDIPQIIDIINLGLMLVERDEEVPTS